MRRAEIGVNATAVRKCDASALVEVWVPFKAIKRSKGHLIDFIHFPRNSVLAAGHKRWEQPHVMQLKGGRGLGPVYKPRVYKKPVISLTSEQCPIDKDMLQPVNFARQHGSLLWP